MSDHGTERQKPMSAQMSAFGGRPDSFCSPRAFPSLTDAVEKVGSVPPARNNRIAGTGFLNRSCAKVPFKILFQQHRPEAAVRSDQRSSWTTTLSGIAPNLAGARSTG